jgi:hypothetical protein
MVSSNKIYDDVYTVSETMEELRRELDQVWNLSFIVFFVMFHVLFSFILSQVVFCIILFYITSFITVLFSQVQLHHFLVLIFVFMTNSDVYRIIEICFDYLSIYPFINFLISLCFTLLFIISTDAIRVIIRTKKIKTVKTSYRNAIPPSCCKCYSV